MTFSPVPKSLLGDGCSPHEREHIRRQTFRHARYEIQLMLHFSAMSNVVGILPERNRHLAV